MKMFISKAEVRKLIILLPAIFFFKFIPSVKAQCGNPVFYEGFESGTIVPTWTTIATFSTFVASVNTNTPNSGNFKLQMTGLTSHLGGIFTTFATSTPTIVKWSIFPHPVAYASNYFVLGDAAVTWSNCLVFCGWVNTNATSGNIRFHSNSGYIDYPASNLQWYAIELRNIDYFAKTSDIWINNTLFATAFPFRSSTLVNVSHLHLYNLTAVGTSSYDDIMIGDGMFASLSVSPPVCNGGTNGASTVTPVGGTGPYTYSWSTAATTSVVTNLSANSVYTVQITDANSCVATKTLLLPQPPPVTTSMITTTVSCFGNNNGSATLTSSGGAGQYSYTINGAPTTSVINALGAGSYSLNTSDANGCTNNTTLQIAGPQAPVGSTHSVMNVSCFGGNNGSALVQGTGGAGAYSYSWIPVGGVTSQKNNLSAGTYTCIVKDGNNCAHTTIINVTQPTAITALTTHTAITCVVQGAASVSASGGIPPFTYSWSPSGGSSAFATNIAAGIHSVTVKDANNCAKNFTLNVTQNIQTPTIVASSERSLICNGETVVLSASGDGDTYLWSNGFTTPSIAITPTSTANYTVTTTFLANGCESNAQIIQYVSSCLGLDNLMRDVNSIKMLSTDGELNFSSPGSGQYEIWSIDGKFIKKGLIQNGENILLLKDLANGSYFMKIDLMDHGLKTVRFVR